MRQSPEHGQHAVKLLQGAIDRVRLNVSPGRGNSECSPNLARASRRDAKVVRPIATAPSIALGNIERHRSGGPPQLIAQRPICARYCRHDRRELPNHRLCCLLNLKRHG